MNSIIIGSIISVSINMVLLVLVYVSNPRGLLNRIFAIFAFSLSVWVVANGYIITYGETEANLHISRLITPSSLLVAAAFNYLIQSLANKEKLKLVLMDKLLLTASGAVAIASFTDLNVAFVDGSYQIGLLYTPYILLTAFFVISAGYKGVRSYRSSKGVEKTRIGIFVAAYFVGAMLSIVTASLLPLVFGIESLWNFIAFYAALSAVGTAIAVTRYRLVAVRGVLKKFLAITIVNVLLALVPSFLIFFVVGGYEIESVWFGATAISLALLFGARIRELINTYVVNDPHTKLASFGRELADATVASESFEVFNKKVGALLKKLMGVKSVELHIITASERYVFCSGIKMNDQDREDISIEGTYFAYAKETDRILDDLDLSASHYYTSSIADDLSLFIALGQKSDGSILTRAEERVFVAAVSSVQVSVLNVFRYLQVANFAKTLRKKVDEATIELKQLNATKDEFIAMASHQLRPQLGAAIGIGEMLADNKKLASKPDVRESLETMNQALMRMSTIVMNMLSSQMLRRGEVELHLKQVDFASLVCQEMSRQKTSAKDKSIKLKLHIPKNLKKVSIDELKISQVITNLLENAITYSPSKSTVDVTIGQDKKHTTLTVADQGIGIPKKDLPKITQQFYRAKNAKAVRPTGTGIGMFLVQRFVDAHNGIIVINSVEDKGTTIQINLPNKRK